MSAVRFEDGPPCVPAREPRKSTIRTKPVIANRYLVCWGLGESELGFATFAEALACYVEHIDARGGAKVWNLEQCDDTSAGLTEVERDAIELADEMHVVGVA